MMVILPSMGSGTTRSVVEGQAPLSVMRGCPSTVLRTVPLPVPGRI